MKNDHGTQINADTVDFQLHQRVETDFADWRVALPCPEGGFYVCPSGYPDCVAQAIDHIMVYIIPEWGSTGNGVQNFSVFFFYHSEAFAHDMSNVGK